MQRRTMCVFRLSGQWLSNWEVTGVCARERQREKARVREGQSTERRFFAMQNNAPASAMRVALLNPSAAVLLLYRRFDRTDKRAGGSELLQDTDAQTNEQAAHRNLALGSRHCDQQQHHHRNYHHHHPLWRRRSSSNSNICNIPRSVSV